MPNRDQPPTLLDEALDEAKGMAQGGMRHPSTKPVLAGAAIGAAEGFLLPVLTIPVGVVGGAVFAFYNRIKK